MIIGFTDGKNYERPSKISFNILISSDAWGNEEFDVMLTVDEQKVFFEKRHIHFAKMYDVKMGTK